MRVLSAFFLLLCFQQYALTQNVTVSGYVKESGSLEHLPGVVVYDADRKVGATTNKYGFYSLSLPKDTYNLVYSYMGYVPISINSHFKQDTTINILFEKEAKKIAEVVVSANVKTVKESERVQMSSINIPVQQIKDVPSLLGEKDVLKVIQLMPGVQSGGEGQSGIYVRGGGPDQNLIILDDAVVYNASHLFGFFSLFNGDALKSVELIKGGFPARYGGRLSSVVDMSMKEGSRDQFKGEFGMGVISSRGVFEGPLPGSKGKGSFVVAARRTYIDLLIQPIMFLQSGGDQVGGYFFHDFNTKLNYDIGPRDKLYLSTYFGKDRFYYRFSTKYLKQRAKLNWGNSTATLRWNHLINNKTFSNTSLVFSSYKLGLEAEDQWQGEDFELDFRSSVQDFSLKHDIDYYLSTRHTITMGGILTYHRFNPNAVVVKATELPGKLGTRNLNQAVETGIYIEDTYLPISRLKINGGMRLSHFHQGGTDYINPEPRISTAYTIAPNLSVKGSFALMNQYIHLLSNTGIGLPTDLWVPTTANIKPQRAIQYAVGISRDIPKLKSSVVLEAYYKRMNNILAYKEGSSFIDADIKGDKVTFPDWQEKVTAGSGTSYGMEMFIQKKYGKFNGWIGYTLSWTEFVFDALNNGKPFWAKYDRRHDFSFVAIYKISEWVKLSATWVYGTGNAISLGSSTYSTYSIDDVIPQLSYDHIFSKVYDYGEKNAYRMRAYHRMDLGIQMTKETKKGRIRTWEFSLYNAYNRANPFFYMSQTVDPDEIENNGDEYTGLFQVSIFPVVPAITYTLKFN